MACIAGLFFGAAIACRATLVFYPLCFAACLTADSILRKRTPAMIFKQSCSLLAPVAVSAGLLLLYNHARFGDFFYSGLRHVALPFPKVYEYCCLQGNYFRLAHVPYHLYYWLLGVPDVALWGWFPYLSRPLDATVLNEVMVLREKVGSIFLLTPVLLLILPVPGLLQHTRGRTPLNLIILGCAACSLLVFGFLTTYYFACARFLYEFTPLLFILVFFALVRLWEKAEGNARPRRALLSILGILLTANCLAGVILATTGTIQ